MSVTLKNAYYEIYQILLFLGDDFIKKIPYNFIEFIENEKNDDYEFYIDPNIPLENQELLEDTINILAMLKLEYWCDSEDEKEELSNLFSYNEEKYQAELREKYNPDKIFKNIDVQKVENNAQNLPVEVKNEKWFEKVVNLFKKIFNIV